MSPHCVRPVAVAVALLVALVGCKRPALPSVGSAAPKIAESGPPVSEQEAEEFGRQVVAAFTAPDADALARLLRIDDVCERSISDFNLTASERKSAVDGFRKNGGGAQMCRGWVEQTAGATTTLLRTREKDGRRTALVRFRGDEFGLNYFEFTLARAADGRVVTEDVYLFLAGESLTQLLRRVMLTALPAKYGGSGQGQVYLENSAAIKRMQACVQSGEKAEARRIYTGLPKSIRNEKFIMLVALQAFQDDEPAYLAEMERYRQRHPNDPSVDLVSVDYHVLKKDGKSLRECLRRLDEAVGGDPSLRLIDATFHFSRGDHAETRRLANEVVELEPALQSGYFVLIDVALAEDDHPETLHLLKQVVEKCQFPLDAVAMKDKDPYTRFGTSKEYRELVRWMERRAK